MDGMTWLWIILAALAVLLVVGLSTRSGRRRAAAQGRADADRLRAQAQANELDLRERQAKVDEAEARARRSRAEADERQAQARRAEVEAQRLGADRDAALAEHEATLREADRRDPDVRTDADGYRLDEAGRRVEAGDAATVRGRGEAPPRADEWGAPSSAALADKERERDLHRASVERPAADGEPVSPSYDERHARHWQDGRAVSSAEDDPARHDAEERLRERIEGRPERPHGDDAR